MFKRLLRRLRKAVWVALAGITYLGTLLFLLWTSHTTIKTATNHGHPWIGWAAVVVFWLILIAAGMGMRSSGNDEKGKEGNN